MCHDRRYRLITVRDRNGRWRGYIVSPPCGQYRLSNIDFRRHATRRVSREEQLYRPISKLTWAVLAHRLTLISVGSKRQPVWRRTKLHVMHLCRHIGLLQIDPSVTVRPPADHRSTSADHRYVKVHWTSKKQPVDDCSTRDCLLPRDWTTIHLRGYVLLDNDDDDNEWMLSWNRPLIRFPVRDLDPDLYSSQIHIATTPSLPVLNCCWHVFSVWTELVG